MKPIKKKQLYQKTVTHHSEFISAEASAEILHTNVSDLMLMVQAGQIPFYEIDDQIVFNESEVRSLYEIKP